MRKSKQTVANSIDNESTNIPNHFAEIYGQLFNSVKDKDELIGVNNTLSDLINNTAMDDVEKVTANKLKEATKNLKADKIDPQFNFTSDCLKNAPDVFFQHLETILRSFLVHGHVSLVLLLATLVPLIKNKLGNTCSSKNYRSIAISSLILKIFDWLIILLFGDTLGLDDLQFSYQPKCSTTMCSWLVIETVSYFLRNNSEVFCCMTDMTKAFDLVMHSVLFKKLIRLGLSPIFIRLSLVMYVTQYANVRWNGTFSSEFSLSNGVKQGAVLSAILYCVYVNGLFMQLRENQSGCRIGQDYLGILGYADDNFLLSPTLDGLQEMLDTCQKYASEHNLQFSTDPIPAKSKTKCLAFLLKERSIRKLELNGNKLPWWPTGKHLGNKIENQINGMKMDIKEKRAKFIDRTNEICQEFHFGHPESKFKVNNIYNSHFTGSPLWNLFSKESESFEKTWNIAFRIMFDLPRETHRYFVEEVSEAPHLKTVLIKSFLSFVDSLRNSNKKALRNLFLKIRKDTQSVTGYNLRKILLLGNKGDVDLLNPIDANEIKYYPVPEAEKWRIGFVKELTDIKFGRMTLDGFTTEEINDLLHIICTS